MSKRVTIGGAHFRGLAPGQPSFEETSQRWWSVADLTDPGIEPHTYRTDCNVLSNWTNRPVIFQTIRLGMFELHCGDLITVLAKRADGLAQKMLFQMSKKHQNENERSVFLFTLELWDIHLYSAISCMYGQFWTENLLLHLGKMCCELALLHLRTPDYISYVTGFSQESSSSFETFDPRMCH